MRDPQGRLFIGPEFATRKLYVALSLNHILRERISDDLVAKKLILPFEIVEDGRLLRSPTVPFVTHPYEWCNRQFFDAAELTLQISELLNSKSYELKDASSWNVIFNGCTPIFCDHLSFQKRNDEAWWAFGQFVRHFIFSLALAKYSGFTASQTFLLNRDGISPNHVRKIIGIRRFFTRIWPLMVENKTSRPIIEPRKIDHYNLYATCRWMLNGSVPLFSKPSNWSTYTNSRSHYTDASLQKKRNTISRWISHCQPKWVVDLGCNTGEFSLLAAEVGASSIAIDSDHDSIEHLYTTNSGNTNIYPVLANLDDLYGGRGWAGSEFPSLWLRLKDKGDMVFMLALIHHLSISNSIPYVEIFKLAAHISKKYLIVELLRSDDPLVFHLSTQRMRSTAEFDLDKQLEGLKAHFNPLEILEIEGTKRLLILAERK